MRPKNKAKENCCQSAAAATRATLSQGQAERAADRGWGRRTEPFGGGTGQGTVAVAVNTCTNNEIGKRELHGLGQLYRGVGGARQGFPLI